MIKMSLGREVDLGPGDIVLDGDLAMGVFTIGPLGPCPPLLGSK